ncbi:hypothetical protein ACFWNL_18300 [Kitasatospora sp. NPDC058397]|uniref:hypothetical protein n=1 Tax=unclassified Kitasatospora TaxID=2633591 RepID=UPI00365BB1D9
MEELDVPDAGDMAARVLKFMAVQGQLVNLKVQMAALSQRVNSARRQMEGDAEQARKLVDMSGPAGVAPEFLARIEEVAASLLGVSESAAVLVSAADAASVAADDTQSEHKSEYGGIYEVAQTRKHPMAKPGFYRVR